MPLPSGLWLVYHLPPRTRVLNWPLAHFLKLCSLAHVLLDTELSSHGPALTKRLLITNKRPLWFLYSSLVAQLVKNLPAMWETWVRSLGWEDPMEKVKATHSSSGLENSMDYTVHGVTKSQTWLSNFHWASLIAQLVKNPPVVQETPIWSLGQEDLLEKGLGNPLQCSWASLVAQLVKNLPAMWDTWVFNPWVGKIPWRREKYPLQYSGLESSMNYIVHGVARSWTQLSDFHFTSDSLIISWCLQDWWCKKTLHKGRGDYPLLENLLSFWDFSIKYHCHHHIDYIGYCCSFDTAAQMWAQVGVVP